MKDLKITVNRIVFKSKLYGSEVEVMSAMIQVKLVRPRVEEVIVARKEEMNINCLSTIFKSLPL